MINFKIVRIKLKIIWVHNLGHNKYTKIEGSIGQRIKIESEIMMVIPTVIVYLMMIVIRKDMLVTNGNSGIKNGDSDPTNSF